MPPDYKQVELEKGVELCFKQSFAALSTNILCIAILYVTFWTTGQITAITAFALMYAALSIFRLKLVSSYQADPSLHSAEHWRNLLVMTMLAVSMGWGGLCYHLIGNSSSLQMLTIVVIMSGLMTGAILSCSPLLPVFLAFSIPFSGGVFLGLVVHSDDIPLGLLSLLVVWFFGLWICAKMFQTFLSQLVRTQLHLLEEKERVEEYAQELSQLATVDPLTGVKNRRYFDEAMDRELSRATRSGSELSLILADADFFKQLNDRFGHPGGDACLVALANTLRSEAKRATDNVTRLGGEEFAIILPQASAEDALALAERCRQSIESLQITPEFINEPIRVTMSFGVATLKPCKDTTARVMMNLADRALYAAKANGRNCVEHVTNLPV